MDAAGTELADRLRALLAGEPTLDEKRMFGSRAFMVNGRILVAARGGGTLLVRVPEERSASLQQRPGARIASMGERTMGQGWLDIDPAVLDDDELIFWLDAARDHDLRG
ncbi:TfoX/Sxy family protein [Microbacterium sp. NPDC058345]|uniref:TfoX/Sxy family protein n=1 Tax=Microbacterium sp. NPDC058345 TaxID=3346455 RepID=UPI0036545877